MSTNQNPITAAQMGKVIQTLSGVDADAFQARGIPIIHFLAEYLRQERPRPISLIAMRQIMGLPIISQAFARVPWVKLVPSVRLSVFPARPGVKKEMWTTLARIYPQDVGLHSEGTAPSEVLGMALKCGFQLIPHEAFKSLLESEFSGKKDSGYMMAYLESPGDRADKNRSLFVSDRPGGLWGASEQAPMERRPDRELPENWSILVAASTFEQTN